MARNPMAGRPYGNSNATSGIPQNYSITQQLGQQGQGAGWSPTPPANWQNPQPRYRFGQRMNYGPGASRMMPPPAQYTGSRAGGNLAQNPAFTDWYNMHVLPGMLTPPSMPMPIAPGAMSGSGQMYGVTPELQAFAASQGWTIVPPNTPGAVIGGFPNGQQFSVLTGQPIVPMITG